MKGRVDQLIAELLADDQRYEGRASADLARLWRRYLYPHRLKLLVAAIAALIFGGVQMLFPLAGAFLVDRVLMVTTGVEPGDVARQVALVPIYVGMLFSIWTAHLVSQTVQSWCTLLTVRRVAEQLREELHRKLQILHIGYYDQTPSGKVVSRVMDDVNVIRSMVASHGVTLVTSASQLLFGVIVLLSLNARLALLLLFAVPAYAYIFRRMLPRIRRANIAIRRLNSRLYGRASERLAGIDVINAFAQERREQREFAAAVFDYVRLGNRLVWHNHMLTFLAGIVTSVTTAAVLYLSALAVRDGRMTLGQMMAFYGVAGAVFLPVNNLMSLVAEFQGLMVVLRRVYHLLDEPEQVRSGRLQLTGIRGTIEFDHVSFHYEDQQDHALEDINLVIEHGERIALMGPSGAGKSTLFQLLLRFYDPQSGVVRVGGVDVPEADVSSLRQHVRMVQQEPALFAGSIADNVAYGQDTATPRQIMDACQKAELHDFILSLPVKYETEIGESGVTLSGGQRQRLALATALLTDPEVLLLDDTTSALDAATEARIRQTLSNVLAGRTSVIITQRIATARDCDRIIVLEHGRVSQSGTHDELVAADGFYRRICEQQNTG